MCGGGLSDAGAAEDETCTRGERGDTPACAAGANVLTRLRPDHALGFEWSAGAYRWLSGDRWGAM